MHNDSIKLGSMEVCTLVIIYRSDNLLISLLRMQSHTQGKEILRQDEKEKKSFYK